MSTQRLLYLDAHHLAAYGWQRGRLTQEAVFEPVPDQVAAFAQYLAAHPGSHYRLLANVAEEGYQSETIPFLQGSDRRTLINRKLGQYFFGTPLTTAIHLGYEKGLRKNEQLLLMGLTAPALFEPWLTALAQAEVPLAGLYSVAQLGPALLRKIGFGMGRCLLLSAHDHTLRESYLDNGQIVFSRTAPLPQSSVAGLAAAFATEAGKLHQYLIGQRLIGRNDPLPVVVLAHPQAMAAIRQTCIDGNGLVFQITDNHQAAARIGLQTFPENSRSDWLYLHLLATSPPPQQFLGDEGRHAYQIDRIKGGLLRFGFLSLLAALLFASHEQYQAYSLRQDAASLTTQATQADQRYQSIAATYPQLGIDHDTLRQVTDRYIALQRNQHLPDALFKEISLALDNSPAIDIDSIEWKQIAPASGQPGNATPAADSLSRYTGEKALIRGTVRASNAASPREILATLEAFAQQLRSRPGLRVEVQQQPFDVASGRALKGGDLDSVAATHPFALQVSREFQP